MEGSNENDKSSPGELIESEFDRDLDDLLENYDSLGLQLYQKQNALLCESVKEERINRSDTI